MVLTLDGVAFLSVLTSWACAERVGANRARASHCLTGVSATATAMLRYPHSRRRRGRFHWWPLRLSSPSLCRYAASERTGSRGDGLPRSDGGCEAGGLTL
ncbi:hypothetical protein GH5_03561 [Leishmania sp. Ghana 2012 LV757]|uniref:hypothetical protein n=1 Tax=Leishmania sp. Ghana 2012 LV757 TaxID=2803181 RepID=UPI001B49D37A|nr:hypothetical protein GH5_03561 [Leishmania sp. Ghana 2012 LV757]